MTALGGPPLAFIPICGISSPEKAEICRRMGADRIIDQAAEGYPFWDGDQQNPDEWKRLAARISCQASRCVKRFRGSDAELGMIHHS